MFHLGSRFVLLAVIVACGSKAAEDKKDALSTPKPSVPPATTPPVVALPPAAQGFWVSNSQSRLVGRFDLQGNKVGEVDFQSVSSTGGVSAVGALNDKIAFAIVDQALSSGGETVVTFDPVSGALLNNAWWKDVSIFNNVVSRAVLTQVFPNSVLLPTNTTVERLLVETAGGSRMLGIGGGSSSYLGPISTGVCAYNTIGNVAVFDAGGKKNLLLLGTGTLPQLKIFSGADAAPVCESSYDYSISGPALTTNTHVPVAALPMPDGRIYVLYQHPSTPKIVSYSTDGKTLNDPKIVYQDLVALGAAPLGLVKVSDASFLVGNSTLGKVFEVTTAGTLGTISVASSFTSSVSSIAIIP